MTLRTTQVIAAVAARAVIGGVVGVCVAPAAPAEAMGALGTDNRLTGGTTPCCDYGVFLRSSDIRLAKAALVMVAFWRAHRGFELSR